MKRVTRKPAYRVEWYYPGEGWREFELDNEADAKAAYEALQTLWRISPFGYSKVSARLPQIDATDWEVPEWAE